MAQTTEAECQPAPAFSTKQVVCCRDSGGVMAFSPSIIEIGYIDDDEPPSDRSDASSTADAGKPAGDLMDAANTGKPTSELLVGSSTAGAEKPRSDLMDTDNAEKTPSDNVNKIPSDLSDGSPTAGAEKPPSDLMDQSSTADCDRPSFDLLDGPSTADATKHSSELDQESSTVDVDEPFSVAFDEPSTPNANEPASDLQNESFAGEAGKLSSDFVDQSSTPDAGKPANDDASSITYEAERSAAEPFSKVVTEDSLQNPSPATHFSRETLTYNHVPPEEVPDHEVVQTSHSNHIFTSDITNDHPQAPDSSETEDKDDSSINSNSLNVSSTADDIVMEPSPAQTLEESMITLQLALEDRSTLIAFERLDKKKLDEPMEDAKALENVPKNRYKDVLPYDASRVVLKDGSDGDYINASFVQMKLPPPRKPTEYIATQGPLPQTCNDFWQMVWEEKCGIVVMVTTLKERNRIKCHQYWPDLYQSETYDKLQVTCFSETTSATGIMRDFLISNPKVNEERHVIQLQYINWPDHGVPEDSSDFLQFVQQLRDLRRDIGGKVVVHCSAGVGRTGVLILMETAMGYIDADEPIYPLEMVKEMRDQRVMMVQTMVQYRFICEALLKAYKDRCKMIESE